jgi:hypothetical protein
MREYAALFDVTSIQKYVFASNKLKENLGASFLVSDIYESMIASNIALKNIPQKVNGKYDGYIGGGNALFFFDNEDKAKEFVKEWTKSLLILAPGITVASAMSKWDEKDFTKSRNELFDKLKGNKSKYITQTITQRHGISAECQSDGYSMDVWRDIFLDDGKIDKERSSYISAATNAKVVAYDKAKNKIENDYKNLLGNEFCFTGELDKLGQSKGSENHIAIVHIDGNSMGDRFKQLTSLETTKQLSKDVENAVKNSFKTLLQKIVSELADPVKKEYLSLKPDGNKSILPIRPIILGGDDITFVCEGRMGIYYAKIFMEEFAKQNVSDGKPLSSCAGIAVIKTKYPFYKGYQLAEELCANAKSRRRELKDEGSWLDFHIAYGGFSGELKEIRDLHYQAPLGSLIYRPYKLGDNGEFGFDTLIKNVRKLNEKDKNERQKYPNNKLKELREVLTLGQDAASTFVNEMNARELFLPVINNRKYNDELFDGGITPYFDMLELLEYYPKYELEEVNK